MAKSKKKKSGGIVAINKKIQANKSMKANAKRVNAKQKKIAEIRRGIKTDMRARKALRKKLTKQFSK